MNSQQYPKNPKGFEFLRTPTGWIDYEAYENIGRRERARAVVSAFSWLKGRGNRK